MLWFIVAALSVVFLAHTAPFPFLLEAFAPSRSIWRMPVTDPPLVYLTYDDGPNPAATPQLLDVLRDHDARATFFLIDAHVTEETATIVRRMFNEGHAVALHADTRVTDGEVASGIGGASHAQRRSHRAAGRPPPVPAVSSARGMAQRIDVRGPRADRLPAGRLELGTLGLELVPPARRGTAGRAVGSRRIARGYRRHARRPPRESGRGSSVRDRGDPSARARAESARLSFWRAVRAARIRHN